MAAGQGFKTFTTGEVLTAADVNGYLMQGILVFASAAARDAAITSPQEGQCCYLKDTDAVLTYSGSAWVGFDDSNAIQNSIVNAKGDLIAASANDVPAILAVGNNGETLVADSSTSTGLRYQSGVNINGVINGAMDIWQRGTSGFTTTYAYNADRWKQGGASAQTTSRQTVSDTTNLPTIQYCARIQRNSGSTSTSTLEHLYGFESADSYRYAGQVVTLSFYARAGANYSATSSLLNGRIIYGTGTDQSVTSGFTGQTIVGTASATLTTTWQRFSVSGTIAATATQVGILFQATPTGTAGAADYFEVTGVQLELGSVATTFKRSGGTLAGELAACQRYYWRSTPGTTYGTYGIGYATSTTVASVELVTPVTMRISPTAIDYSGVWLQVHNVAGYTITGLTIDTNLAGPKVVTLSASGASGLTQYRPYSLTNNNNTASYVGLSAEL